LHGHLCGCVCGGHGKMEATPDGGSSLIEGAIQWLD